MERERDAFRACVRSERYDVCARACGKTERPTLNRTKKKETKNWPYPHARRDFTWHGVERSIQHHPPGSKHIHRRCQSAKVCVDAYTACGWWWSVVLVCCFVQRKASSRQLWSHLFRLCPVPSVAQPWGEHCTITWKWRCARFTRVKTSPWACPPCQQCRYLCGVQLPRKPFVPVEKKSCKDTNFDSLIGSKIRHRCSQKALHTGCLAKSTVLKDRVCRYFFIEPTEKQDNLFTNKKTFKVGET